MVEIPLAKNFSIQPELLYAQQGTKISLSYEVTNSHYKSNLDLNYLNIPVMLKYYVLKGLTVQAGPQIGILLRLTINTRITFRVMKITKALI
jgi:hypothetical protein